MRLTISLLCALALAFAPAAGTRERGVWKTLAPMPTPRQEISAAVLDGKVYAIAGYDEDGRSTDVVEVYDPTSDSWSSAAPLPIETNHNAAAVVAGRLYAFGGTSNQVFVYDPTSDAWSEVASMRYTHGGTPAVAVIDGKLYVAGGNGPDMVGNEVEVYDPAADRWETLAPMGVPRNHTAGAAIDGLFFVVGGRASVEAPSALEVYDPATNMWSRRAPMPTGRSGIAAAALGGRLYVFGGEIPRLFDEVEVYDPATDAWEGLPPMPTPRHGLFAAVIGNAVYLPGGATEQGLGATDVNEVFRLAPEISGATVAGKALTVTGRYFEPGAVVLVNGHERRTENDPESPTTALVAPKAGKKIRRGRTVTLRVRNPDGATSEPFSYTRPE